MPKLLVRLFLVGSAQELLWISILSLGPLRENTRSFLTLIFLVFILCLWAYFRLPVGSRQATWLLLGFAVLFRITLLFTPPYQSEDVFRYIWDARVASMGISPYAFPPNAPELEKVRDNAVYPMINSKPYVSAYPPLSQVLFRANYRVFSGNVTAMKAMFSLFEFLAVLVAWRLLVLWGRTVQPLVLMAWNPFFVFEFSHSGHSDSLMMLLMLASVYLIFRLQRAWALVCYAGAVLAKLHPVLWFPFFLRRAGWKPALAGLAAGISLVYAYFNFESLLRYLNSLGLYFRLFEFNASIHYLIRFIGRWAFHESWDKVIGPYLGTALLLIIVLLVWKFPVRDARDLLHAGFWIMTADLCLTTTVHPWYLSWAALALPFFPYAFMVYWTGACFLSYFAYSFHPVYEPAWALLLEYLPVYGLMGWELWRRRPLMEVWTQQKSS
jgi:hypothetical protein